MVFLFPPLSPTISAFFVGLFYAFIQMPQATNHLAH